MNDLATLSDAELTALYQQAAPQPTSFANAYSRAAARSLTANLFDELVGLAEAGGRAPDSAEPLGLGNIIRGGYRRMTGDETAGRLYGEATARERAASKKAETDQPGATLAGELTGAFALPLGAAIRAPTLGARMVQGAGVGAAYGGASGFGEGEGLGDSAGRAAFGTGAGGLLGGLGVPIVEGAIKGVGALASYPINAVRGAINPTGAAERAIGRAYGEATQADPRGLNRLRPAELTPGGPATVMDVLGQPGRDLARSAANISGGARDTLNQTLNERFESQGGRLTGWLRSTFHFPDVHSQQAAIKQAAQQVNRPAYGKAFQNPNAASVWDEGFEQMAQAPVMQEAIRGAMVNAKNEAAKMGFTPPRNPFKADADGRIRLMPDKDGNPITPSLQFWDVVKKNLDKMNSRESQFWAQTLRDRLDDIVPDYGVARAGAAHFFKARDAMEAGQNFVAMNFAIPQTRTALAKMTATERQLFQDGFVSRLVETIEAVPDRADVVRRLYNSTAAKDKIQLALGTDRARELEAMLRVEGIMQQSLRAVQGNSTTVLQAVTAGLAGAGGGGWLGFDPTTSGALAAVATAGKRGVDMRVAGRIAELLTSKDPAVFQRGIQMLARNNTMMNRLRAMDSGAARLSSGQASGASLPMSAAGIGRADED